MTARITSRPAADPTGSPLVVVVGEVDLHNAAELHDALATAASNAERVVVDLTKTEYLDSAGIRVLFAHAGRVRLELVVEDNRIVSSVVVVSGLTALVDVR
ncbi:STAS domain-containing protein [Umezawaea beigongshangensis]|uniref:STAS domain-containing protein n=1 Tax=Umezawaea beigongshangensis TaxID=2780383 RepID=UPI0018F17063|nr:STAS domain-containing protein [Umezawaea beigongshangensis]